MERHEPDVNLMESVKRRNERMVDHSGDAEAKKFGRWALSVLKDSTFSPEHRMTPKAHLISR